MTAIARTLPAHLEATRARFPDQAAQRDADGEVSREELLRHAAQLAEGFRRIGIQPGDHVGFIADNSRRWLLADLALQLARAVSVPRGTDTPAEEMQQILKHAEVGFVLAHDAKHAAIIEEVRAGVPSMKEVICLDPKNASGRTLDDVFALGEGGPDFSAQAALVEPADVATIIYTSGTTGRPKGVVLTQSNFGHQVAVIPPLIHMTPREVFLSILPPWHIFERTVEYAALVCGACIAYTNRRRFKSDMATFQPTFMASVPRLWETVYDGVRKAIREGSPLKRGVFQSAYAMATLRAWGWDRARGHTLRVHRPHGLGLFREGLMRALGLSLATITYPLDWVAQKAVFAKIRQATGGRMRGAISGGGLLPPHLDRFFRTIGVPILIGYGLTETSPVVAVRREERNVLGTIGVAIPEVDVQIRDPENGRPLPAGSIGLVFTRGPMVMSGYYKDPSLTREVIDTNGWFNTGDLGFLTEFGDLCFRGRAKETIVLSGGENVEPSHVEAALLASPLVNQAIVVGQDRKTLAALVLPDAAALGEAMGLTEELEPAALATRADVHDAMRAECVRATSGLLPFERIARIAVLPEALDVASGCLTQTLKLKRHVITQRYEELIQQAYGG